MEQFGLIQKLVDTHLRDEMAVIIEAGREYFVWAPDAAFGAADVLLKSLGSSEGQS